MNRDAAPATGSIFLPAPDLIDFFIILLLAIACDIAIFWLGTQFANSAVFQQLPGFVTGAFSGVWSSVATGAAGIGLAIVKALTRKDGAKPNYALYVLITAVLILAATYIAAASSLAMAPRMPGLNPLPGVTLVDPAKTGQQTFDLETPPGSPAYYNYALVGTYTVKDGHLTGHLKPSSFRSLENYDPRYGVRLSRVSIHLCYIHKSNGGVVPAGQEMYDMVPIAPRASNSVYLDMAITDKNQVFTLPQLDFTIDIPADFKTGRGWLCGMIGNSVGNYFPAY